MKTKTFKIGECAIGGIIKVQITGKVVLVQALDWDTKEVVSSGSCMTTDEDWDFKTERYLQDLSTYYYAEKIMEWINSKVKTSSFESWVFNQNVSQI